jgi:hypothetical protein
VRSVPLKRKRSDDDNEAVAPLFDRVKTEKADDCHDDGEEDTLSSAGFLKQVKKEMKGEERNEGEGVVDRDSPRPSKKKAKRSGADDDAPQSIIYVTDAELGFGSQKDQEATTATGAGHGKPPPPLFPPLSHSFFCRPCLGSRPPVVFVLSLPPPPNHSDYDRF